MSLLSNYLVKNVALLHLGKRWLGGLCADIAEAARTGSYLETAGNKADTLHRYVSALDEATLKRSYELSVRQVLKKLNLKDVELAIDGKKDAYFGKQGGLHSRRTKFERGTDQAWEYIVVSIVKPLKIPLMAVRYPQGADLSKCCVELLDYVKRLSLNVKMIYFDRGFYTSKLIDYLENVKERSPLPYLILVRRDKKIKNYIEQTEHFRIFKHEFKYSHDKSTWKPRTRIVVCKNAGVNKKGEPYHMIFATNNKNPSRKLITEYKKRWNIETSFRIMEEAKIKTKSNNKIIRLFYFLLRCLLHTIWSLNNKIAKYFVMKKYLRKIEYTLRGFAKTKPPPKQLFW